MHICLHCSYKLKLLLIAIVISLFFDPTIKANTRPDNLAADENVKKYRINVIDPVIAKIPGHIKKGIKVNPKKYLPLLVKFFKKGSQNKYHTVKRIHDWITDNIAYDTDKFYGIGRGTSRPYEIVKVSRTTCGGFSSLFKEMTTLAGIETVRISGKSRNYISTRGSVSGHAWNAVKINGKWYIVDSTADNRFGYKHKKFSEKNKYRSKSLFLDPDAKLIVNYPNNPQYFFTENKITLKEFLNRPLLTMNTLDYSDVKFLNLKDIISKHSERKEGGRLIKRYDSIRPDNGIVKFKLTCPKNILISAKLYDENKKRYDFNAVSYNIGDKVYCEFSMPGSGVFSGSIRARYLNYEDTTHSLYKFKVISKKGKGPDLPVQNIVRKNSRFLYNNIKILENNLSTFKRDGYLKIKFSHPENISLYTKLIDKRKKNYKKNIYYDYGKNNRTYYYSFPARGTYLIELFTKDKAKNEKHHQRAAALLIKNKNNKIFSLPPQLELIRYSRFSEKNYKIINSTLKQNNRRLHTITIQAPVEQELSCMIKDSKKKKVDGHSVYNKNNNIYTFQFSTPSSRGSYIAKILSINKERKYNSICYFKIISKGNAGPYLPLKDTLYVQNESDKYGHKIIESNFRNAREKGYYKIVLPQKKDVKYYAGLYNIKGEKFHDYVSTSYEKNRIIYYISPPDWKHYYVKLYFKNPSKDKNYNKILYKFGIQDFARPFKNEAPPYIILIKKRFHKFNLKLVSENVSEMNKSNEAEIKIQVPSNIKLTLSIRDYNKKRYKDYCSMKKEGDVYIMKFKNPPGNKFIARIYGKTLEKKSYNAVLQFYIE